MSESLSMTEPLLPQILKAFKHIGPAIIPMLRDELHYHESSSFSPGVSKESVCDSPADQYPIASPGRDDTSMTSACSPDLSHDIAASSLLQFSDPGLRASSPRSIQPISALHYPPAAMYTGSTKTLDSSSNTNSGPSDSLPRSNSSHPEIPTIQVQTSFDYVD